MRRTGVIGDRSSNRFVPSSRAVAPAVGKTLEIGIGVLVVALLTSTLYGSTVPGYRTTAGDELADRSLSRAIEATETAIPPESRVGSSTVRVGLPTTIRGATYEIHTTENALELRHPHPGIGRTTPIAVPDRVVSLTGTWRSTDPFLVTASVADGDVAIRIGGPRA